MIKLLASLAFLVFFDSGCNQPATISGPAGYDLAKPETMPMPGVLNEISGIAFNRGNPDTIYAEQDEEGSLFAFSPGDKNTTRWKFGKKGDYEDISIANGIVYILRSEGSLFSFSLQPGGGEEIINVTESPKLLPKGEYEGMYADEAAGLLYVLCKSCNDDNASKSITGHILQIAGNAVTYKNSFQVSARDIAVKTGDKKIAFRPSALAKNPATNEWYLLSSVNKLLVIADAQWSIREVHPLNPALFMQPEGIAFDKNNALYIANERASTGNATILKYSFSKNKK